MRVGKYHIEYIEKRYSRLGRLGWNTSHPYWYLWKVSIHLGPWSFFWEILRTDWNKCYKENCKNYTLRCKHNIECNQCSPCFEE